MADGSIARRKGLTSDPPVSDRRARADGHGWLGASGQRRRNPLSTCLRCPELDLAAVLLEMHSLAGRDAEADRIARSGAIVLTQCCTPPSDTPMLLALDTATEICAVALVRDAEVIERVEHVDQRHSQRLIPMAQSLLAEAGIGLSALDAVAFGAGPGSFTGLRIACGVAQGLAYAIDRPVVAVGNLEALALDAARAVPGARRVATAIDARMGECYWAVFQVHRGRDAAVPHPAAGRDSAAGALDDASEIGLTQIVAPSLSRPEALPDLLLDLAPDTLVGEAFAQFAAQLDRISAACRPLQAAASAGSIGLLGVRGLRAGFAVEPSLAAPVYVRDRVAQTIEERLASRAARPS